MMARNVAFLTCALAILILIIPPVDATRIALDFQNPGDQTSVEYVGSGSCTWYESSDGTNNFMSCPIDQGYVRNSNFFAMNYAAITQLMGSTVGVRLYDSSGITMWSGTTQYGAYYPIRVEVKIVGGTAYLYNTGVLVSTSPPLSLNPYAIGFSGGHLDDAIWSSDYSESRYIVGMPESFDYTLKKDDLNSLASGLYANMTVINSHNMTTTFSKDNANTETMFLRHTGTGQVIAQGNVSSWTGSYVWPIENDIFDKITSAAPYGSYVAYLSGSPTTLSEPIQYTTVSSSAVFWGSHNYSVGDTATYTWNVDSGYWDTSTYTYKMQVMDVYGIIKQTTPITTQGGSGSYSFVPNVDDEGVYYVAMIATKTSSSESFWLNYDYTTVVGYLRYKGYVNDAENQTGISSASVKICQNTICYTGVTGANGWYDTSGTAIWAGSPTIFDVTKSGHDAYNETFTPLGAKSVNLNFTLLPTNHTTVGLSIGGISTDSTYGRPIPGATVVVSNITHGESYSTTANSVGYYKIDESDGVIFTNLRLYSIVASKLGYANSTTYEKLVVGS